jgi:hypothetical protein
MGDWGTKISKDDKSITSTTPEDYVLSTAYNTLKIANEVYGEDLEAGDSFNILEEVDHNLGYIPQFRAYFYNSDDDRWFVPPVVTDHIMCGYALSDTTFALGIYTTILLPPPPADTVIKWKIYIFEDPEVEAWT